MINLSNMLPYDHEPHTPTDKDTCLVCGGKVIAGIATQKHRSMRYSDEPNHIEIYFLGFMCGDAECSIRGIQSATNDVRGLPLCYSGTIR
jgi:hypothetical protein